MHFYEGVSDILIKQHTARFLNLNLQPKLLLLGVFELLLKGEKLLLIKHCANRVFYWSAAVDHI